MRTTIDIPDDLHEVAKSIARDRSQTLSDVVVDLMRRGLGRRAVDPEITFHPETGFPTIRVGRPVTTEDVRSLEDHE